MTRFVFITMVLIGALASFAHAAAVCEVQVNAAAFGVYDPLGYSQRDTTGTISVTCTGVVGDTVNYDIAISAGNSSVSTRRLDSGADQLSYNLYRDAARSQIWGDGTNNTFTLGDSYTLSTTTMTRDYTVYGRITGGQHQAREGAYSDEMIVTLTY